MCYCYLHIFPNEKIYVGTTQKTPERRWQNGYGYRTQQLMWNAICKYGWENVRHKVIECETPEEMWEKEKELIKKYDTTNPAKGYNISVGGEKSAFGCHPTEEHRRKNSEALKGDKNPSKRPEVRRKISESAKNRPPITEDTRKKMSESAKNKPPMSESTKQKLRDAFKGDKNPSKRPEVREKLSKANKGKIIKESIRRKISDKMKGISKSKQKWLTPQGEIKEMHFSNVAQWHPDWILIQNKE